MDSSVFGIELLKECVESYSCVNRVHCASFFKGTECDVCSSNEGFSYDNR